MRTVLKIGGSILEPEPAPALVDSIARRVRAGDQVLLVHGGGKSLTALLRKLDHQSEFRNGLRVTDAVTLQSALMVLAGSVNKGLVARLNASPAGPIKAVGLCGLDAACIQAQVANPELGFVGEVTGGDAALLNTLLQANFTPVLASLAFDGNGGALNVNADQFAAACARLVGAQRIVFVTDVAGVLDGNGERIPMLGMDQLEGLAVSGAISGGMLPKLAACREALEAGVGEIEIVGKEAALDFAGWDAEHCPGTRIVASRKAVASRGQTARV